MPAVSEPQNSTQSLPAEEIEIFVNQDGSVTFADMSEHALSIARELNPQPLFCDLALSVLGEITRTK